MCIALCTIVVHNIAQNRPDNFSSYPPDNHHCSETPKQLYLFLFTIPITSLTVILLIGVMMMMMIIDYVLAAVLFAPTRWLSLEHWPCDVEVVVRSTYCRELQRGYLGDGSFAATWVVRPVDGRPRTTAALP